MKSKALVVLACMTAPTAANAGSDGTFTNVAFPPNFPAAYKRYSVRLRFLPVAVFCFSALSRASRRLRG